LVFSFIEGAGDAQHIFANVGGKVKISDPHTVYLRLPENYFEPQTLLSIMRKMSSQEIEKPNVKSATGRQAVGLNMEIMGAKPRNKLRG
jgi:hypothetical protein